MKKPDQTQNFRKKRIIGALIFVVMMYFATFGFGPHPEEFAFGVALLIFPFVVGLCTPLILDPGRSMRFWPVFGLTVLVYAVLVTFLIAVGLETAICLVIGAPIFLIFTLLGMSIARDICARADVEAGNKTYAVVFVLPVLLAPVDLSYAFTPSQQSVVNQITINATPQQVWAQIITFPPIQPDERKWSVSHTILGAPVPIGSHMDGDVRHAQWTMGVTYEERLTQIVEGRHMAWDIHFADDFDMDGIDDHIQPNSRQLFLERGQYDLTYDGQNTTLTLRTDYRLQTFWNGYVSQWGQLFLGDNHNAILHVIKQRAEAAHG